MRHSQKCQYALRAVFELAKGYGRGTRRIADIAEAQAVPPRFLEVILAQLKQGKFVTSQRGNQGGYQLAREPSGLTVGEIIRFVDGPLGPVGCVAGEGDGAECPLRGKCVFLPMWERAKEALSGVYDSVTFEGLIEEERLMNDRHAPSYQI